MRILDGTLGGFAVTGLQLALLLLALHPGVSQPVSDNENDIAALPPDADNVEFHHVKVVDGVMHENHPVVMYKEDFVSEDYDPSKNESKAKEHKKRTHAQHIRHHHSRPGVERHQKKIRFDVLPESPIVIADDDSGVDKFEVSPLLQPKSRVARDVQQRPKRRINEVYTGNNYVPQNNYNVYSKPYYANSQPHYTAHHPNYVGYQNTPFRQFPVNQKPPVLTGPNPEWRNRVTPVIGNRDGFTPDFDSLIHNTNQEDADFDVFNQPRPSSQPAAQDPDRRPSWGASQPRPTPQTTRAPAWQQTAQGAFNPPARPPLRPLQSTTDGPLGAASLNGNVWESSPSQSRPSPPRITTVAPNRRVSNCVWAILQCCSPDSPEIRYNCFEDFNCYGAFWDHNPCSARIRSKALKAVRKTRN